MDRSLTPTPVVRPHSRLCAGAAIVLAVVVAGCSGDDAQVADQTVVTASSDATSTTTPVSSPARTTEPAVTSPSTTVEPTTTGEPAAPGLSELEPQIRDTLSASLEPGFYTIASDTLTEALPSGVSMGIRVPGQPDLLVGVGVEAGPAGAPFDATAPFLVGGETENMLYTLFDMLVDDGAIDPSDTLATWLPSYPNANDITAQMLRDGMYGGHGMAGIANWLELVSADWSRTWSPEEILAEAATQPAGAIGDQGSGTTAITALLYVIEHSTGETFDQLIRERLFEPLGLTATGVVDPDHLPANFSHGVFNLGGEAHTSADFPLNSYTSMFVDVVSTTSDQLTLAQAIATGGVPGFARLPTPDKFPSARLQSDDDGDRYIGDGFPLNLHCPCTDVGDGHAGTAIGRRANAPGTLTHWYYFPATGITIVLHMNSNESATPQEVMELVYGIHEMVSGQDTPV